MKILITNNSLSELAGSEMFVYELAKQLKKLKHDVSVYIFLEIAKGSTIATKLKRLKVKLINNVDHLTEKYDIIHCHHNNTANIINYKFPDTPKIFVSHGWIFPICIPNIDIKFNKIIAVSEEVQTNLQNKGFKDIQVINNPLDTERFFWEKRTRTTINKMCYASNHAGKPCKLPMINACEHYATKKPEFAQIFCLTKCEQKPMVQIDTLSKTFKATLINAGAHLFLNDKGAIESKNNQVWDIEKALRECDLTFGIGRSALTSMSMGIPTCVYDHFGFAGFVQNKYDFEEFQRTNFSGRIPHFHSNWFPILNPVKFAYEYNKNLTFLKKLSGLVHKNYSAEKVAKKYEQVYRNVIG